VIAAFDDFLGLSRQEVAVGLMRRFGLEEAAMARVETATSHLRRNRPSQTKEAYVPLLP